MQRTILLLVIFLMTSLLPARAQDASAAKPTEGLSFKQLISGSAFPITLKMKQLDGEWRRITLSGASDSNQGGLSPWMLMAFGMAGGLPSSTPTYYTRGQMVM